MYVKPGPNPNGPGGLHVVLFPRTHQQLPPEGAEVPDDHLYWVRRLIVGDVVKADPPAPASEQPAKAAKAAQGVDGSAAA